MASDEDYYNDDSSTNNKNSINEFSRTLRTDRVLHSHHRNAREQQHPREYELTVSADARERRALADRFELTHLTQLEATLTVRPAISSLAVTGSTTTTTTGNVVVVPVEVEGTILAHLTQTCVRTNEPFEVDVEFPLYALVKPMSSFEALMKDGDYLDYAESTNKNDKKKKKSSKKSNKAKLAQSTKQVYSLDDVVDLQAAIEASGALREDSRDSGFQALSSSLVEDEAIYSSKTGILDVGELVAQTFWLQLDPFPKKPGTGPIEMEISG
jgi:hypothetical protein